MIEIHEIKLNENTYYFKSPNMWQMNKILTASIAVANSADKENIDNSSLSIFLESMLCNEDGSPVTLDYIKNELDPFDAINLFAVFEEYIKSKTETIDPKKVLATARKIQV